MHKHPQEAGLLTKHFYINLYFIINIQHLVLKCYENNYNKILNLQKNVKNSKHLYFICILTISHDFRLTGY
jgi:hypothetical protein